MTPIHTGTDAVNLFKPQSSSACSLNRTDVRMNDCFPMEPFAGGRDYIPPYDLW